MKRFCQFTLVITLLISLAASAQSSLRLDEDRPPKDMKSLSEDIRPESRIKYDAIPTFRKSSVSSEDQKLLIEQQIDPRQRSGAAPTLKLQPRNLKPDEIMMEGTGTRGGGSGISTRLPNNQLSVELLDLYRSERPDLYPKFFQIDPELKRLSAELPPDQASEKILQLVMSRLQQVMPHLARKVEIMSQTLAFEKWTATASRFPLLGDYIGDVRLNANQEHVQIAYRRTNQVIYNESLYAGMDGLNRAALKLHEFTYALSSVEHSIQVQRFVSLAFSHRLMEFQSDTELERLQLELGMLGLAMKAPLMQPGAHLGSVRKMPEEDCGKLISMSVDPITKATQVRAYTSRGPRTALLEVEKTKVFLFSILAAKSFLAAQFPLALYPAQQTTQDVICFKSGSLKLSSIEFGISFDPVMSEFEVKAARLEADYFRAQKKLIEADRALDRLPTGPSKPLSKEFQAWRASYTEFKEAELQIEISNLDRITKSSLFDIIERAKALDQYKISFDFD